MFFFQLAIAETAIADQEFKFLDRLWSDWSVSVPFRERDLAKQAIKQPGVLSAALNYYRCLFQTDRRDPAYADLQKRLDTGTISVRTLHIHGDQDQCFGVELLQRMEGYFTTELFKSIIPNTGHFVHLEKSQENLDAIEQFIQR